MVNSGSPATDFWAGGLRVGDGEFVALLDSRLRSEADIPELLRIAVHLRLLPVSAAVPAICALGCHCVPAMAALFLFGRPRYIRRMLWRVRNYRVRPLNAPAAFIHPCQPIVAKQPPSGPGCCWIGTG
jgi:hypothetical protein